MPVNFNMLQPMKPPQIIGQLAPTGGGDDGIGDLMSGLQGLFGGIGKMSGGAANAPTGGAAIGGVNPQYAQMAVQNPSGLNSTPRMQQIVENQGIFKNALSQMGIRENNPALTNYLAKANPGLDPTKTPWCAGYVGSVLNASGMKGTGSLAAKSYLKYGSPTNQPGQGDIVVLHRGSDPSLGHVGFVESIDQKNGVVNVLGGNQDNSVSIKSFPLKQVAGFRRPPSGEQVQQFAQQRQIQSPAALAELPKNPNQFMKALIGVKPDRGLSNMSNLLTNRATEQQPQQQQFSNLSNPHPELQSTMQGISYVESRDAKDPYSLRSKASRNGDRAYGKYQIMGSNIPSWTKEATGKSYTPQEFLANPDIQEQTAAYHINRNLQKYSPEDAASIWFSGRPAKKAGNARDVYGTTVPQYIKMFNQGRGMKTSMNSVMEPTGTGGRFENSSPLAPGEESQEAVDNATPLPFSPLQGYQEQPNAQMAQAGGVNWGLLQSILQQRGQA